MDKPRSALTLDQISKMIAGDGQVTHWRVNAPPRPPARIIDSRFTIYAPIPKTPAARQSSIVNRQSLKPEAVCWRVARWIVLGSALFVCAAPAVLALDPRRPPGGNFDLSHWKLTLPDTNTTEIAPAQLAAGYSNADYFYTGPNGAMIFWCPVKGGVADGSAYPRCELRELLDPNNEAVNWTGAGTNILGAQCKVTQVSSNPVVVIGQIHSFTGNAYPLVKLQYDAGNVEALVTEDPGSNVVTTFPLGTVGRGNLITYQLNLTGGLLTLTVNGRNQSVNVFQTGPAWTNQTFYFKAGDYVQDNTGPVSDGTRVAFYQLSVEHVLPPNSSPAVALVNPAFVGRGRIRFTLRGQGGGTYFIQTSSNLSDWSYALLTNSVSGLIDFTDAAAAGASFYRGGHL